MRGQKNIYLAVGLILLAVLCSSGCDSGAMIELNPMEGGRKPAGTGKLGIDENGTNLDNPSVSSTGRGYRFYLIMGTNRYGIYVTRFPKEKQAVPENWYQIGENGRKVQITETIFVLAINDTPETKLRFRGYVKPGPTGSHKTNLTNDLAVNLLAQSNSVAGLMEFKRLCATQTRDDGWLGGNYYVHKTSVNYNFKDMSDPIGGISQRNGLDFDVDLTDAVDSNGDGYKEIFITFFN